MAAPKQDSDSPVHLGFCEPIENESIIAHTSPNWSEWDGGQVGGRPSWLNPEHLPTRPITCLVCQENEDPLNFICQLYAPADTVNTNAFHRTLYVFACPTCSSVRVFRTQLAQENPYFPSDCDVAVETHWNKHLPETYEIKLCKVCGQRGKGVCPLQQENFCGKLHQKQYKQNVFEKEPPKPLPSVYPIHELVVEEEPSNQDGTYNVEEERSAMFEADDDNDSDQDLEQDDLNAITGARGGDTRKDPLTDDFFHRVEHAKDQCVRYHQWHDESILWTSSDNMPSAIPDCACGAPRRFEFQLMPQLLHYLKSSKNTISGISQQEKDVLLAASSIVETNPDQVPAELKETHEKAIRNMQSKLLDNEKELDWGVVVVYTCTASCDGGADDKGLGAYREEFAWVQQSLS